MNEAEIISPQPGFQTLFLSSPADIIIGGGAAGAGKSHALLIDAMRHVDEDSYGAVIFRQSYPQIMMPGGLWDGATDLFPAVGGFPNQAKVKWSFEDGKSEIAFRHLSHENQLPNYQGAQIPFIGFDELTHFSSKSFFYMMTRNRSTKCPIKPVIRAVCNPDPDSWVADFISWWIDLESGFPIESRAGKLRYYFRKNDAHLWADSKEELLKLYPEIGVEAEKQGVKAQELIKSVTFIPGTIKDNPILIKKDPAYLANLMAQDEQTKLRLLDGNWRIRVDKANLFDFIRINDMFKNMIEDRPEDQYYITCDHARFGRDLCVIGTWRGWKLIRIDVLKKSDTNDVVRIINELRRLHKGIPVSQILVDQDGIGVKDSLDCEIYQGNSSAIMVTNGVKPDFKNLNTQCYYYLADQVNKANISVDLGNVWLHESPTDYYRVENIILSGKEMSVRDMIRDDLRVVRREAIDSESKKQITSKEIRKAANGGRSPDWADMMAQRSYFDLQGQPFYLS